MRNKTVVVIDTKTVMDLNGHGTAVEETIRKVISSSNTYVIIKHIGLCDEDGYAYEHELYAALKNAQAMNPDIVCMAISTSIYSACTELLCKEMHEVGTILVASYSNEDCISYPAQYNSVIGVRCISKKHCIPGVFINSCGTELVINSMIEPIQLEDSVYYFVGNSLATSIIVGVLSSLHIETKCNETLARSAYEEWIKLCQFECEQDDRVERMLSRFYLLASKKNVHIYKLIIDFYIKHFSLKFASNEILLSNCVFPHLLISRLIELTTKNIKTN